MQLITFFVGLALLAILVTGIINNELEYRIIKTIKKVEKIENERKDNC